MRKEITASLSQETKILCGMVAARASPSPRHYCSMTNKHAGRFPTAQCVTPSTSDQGATMTKRPGERTMAQTVAVAVGTRRRRLGTHICAVGPSGVGETGESETHGMTLCCGIASDK